jgi:hypothetical protein
MHTYRLFVSAILITSLGTPPTLQAGEIYGTTGFAVPNNDDHVGPDNPNTAFYLDLSGDVNVDELISVVPTGGITEWRYEMLYFFSTPSGIPEFRVELGFGLGDNFISASQVFPELDFDYPLPSDTWLMVGTYTQVEHFPQLINFSEGDFGTIHLSIDVPDLPEFVKDFYTTEELVDLPEGAVPFTLRRHEGKIDPIPEPSTILLLSAASLLACLGRGRRGRCRPLLVHA